MSTRSDPYRQFNFRLEVDGLQLANFSEVSLGAAVTEVVEYREGGDKSAARKLPGMTKFSNVTLKRGITSSLELYQWHRMVAEGRTTDARRNVAVILSDETGNDVARFTLRNAWPVKYEAPSFNASGNEVAMEIIEIAHEGLTRES
jgi:phage tail-like protein